MAHMAHTTHIEQNGHKDIKLLYLMEVFSGLARGAYLGCIGWTTLAISNDVAAVGQLVIAISMFVIGGMLFLFDHNFSVYWMFIAAIVITCARMMYRGSFDGIIRSSVGDENVLSTVARANTTHLLATAAGMAGVGFIINELSTGHAFTITALSSLVLLFIAVFLSDGMVKTNAKGFKGYWSDFVIGLEIFKHNKSIRMLAFLSATALPVGQLTNAVLSSFIRDDLSMGSDIFGMVDAAWALGGMLAAAILSNKIKEFRDQYGEYYLAIMAGAATIILSYCTAFISLAATHFFMGLFVWLCRIIIAGRVIEQCDSENVGRTRIYMEVMMSISAICMAFSPTLIKLESTSSYFLYWGIFIVGAAMFLLILKRFQSKTD